MIVALGHHMPRYATPSRSSPVALPVLFPALDSPLSLRPDNELMLEFSYSAVHEVACKPIFVFNVFFMDIGTCYWCMLYAKMITKDY